MNVEELTQILKSAGLKDEIAVIAGDSTHTLKDVVICMEGGVILNCEKVKLSKEAGTDSPKRLEHDTGGQSSGPMPLYERGGQHPQ